MGLWLTKEEVTQAETDAYIIKVFTSTYLLLTITTHVPMWSTAHAHVLTSTARSCPLQRVNAVLHVLKHGQSESARIEYPPPLHPSGWLRVTPRE